MNSGQQPNKNMSTQHSSNVKVLQVPYFSQYDSTVDTKWQSRVCGLACLGMVLAYYDLDDPDFNELIEEGLLIGGHNPEHGWYHDALVRILRNKGLHAYAEEFRSINVDLKNKKFTPSPFEEKLAKSGIQKIISELEKERPVIVNVNPDFRNNKGFHLVVIVGYVGDKENLEGFYVHDPDSGEDDEAPKFLYIKLEEFMKFWRKMAVFSSHLFQN